jgi:hypothetical protein
MFLTITPKLKLKEADRKVSLSAIEKSCMRGKSRTMTSTHIMLAPSIQATDVSQESGICGRTDRCH